MSEPFSAAITRYTLAMNDMQAVSGVARLVADHDPNFNLLGPKFDLPSGLEKPYKPCLAVSHPA